MKKFISQSYRRGMLIFISIALILAINGMDVYKKIQSIEKTKITASVDEELREGFESIIDETPTHRYYDVSYSQDTKNSQIIMTSNIENIDKSKDYKIIGHSPLVLVMKQSKKLNDFLISYNKNGFLISDSKIKNQSDDKINCDITKVVDAINNGGNWSSLGGDETQKIIIYCPKLDTTQGKLFKEFLVRSYNKGTNESNEEIENKIQMFFDSDNVIQTDIYNKLELLKDNISENVIFIGFEHDLLRFYQKYNRELNFIYPEKTILEYIYVQVNSEDNRLHKKLFYKGVMADHSRIDGMFYRNYYYRLGETGSYRSLNYSCNLQKGLDTFEN